MAKCYVLIKGFDRETNRIIINELFRSFEEMKPYVSGVKKKECGFAVEYRAFSNLEKAQAFLHSVSRKRTSEEKEHEYKESAKKEETGPKNKNSSSPKKEEKKGKMFLLLFSSNTLVKQISEEFIHIYVDGSYDHHKKIGGGGIIFVKDNLILMRDFIRCTFETTNALSSVAMERLAVKRAIELAIANSYTKIIVHYDFNGIVDCLNEAYKTKDLETKTTKK